MSNYEFVFETKFPKKDQEKLQEIGEKVDKESKLLYEQLAKEEKALDEELKGLENKIKGFENKKEKIAEDFKGCVLKLKEDFYAQNPKLKKLVEEQTALIEKRDNAEHYADENYCCAQAAKDGYPKWPYCNYCYGRVD